MSLEAVIARVGELQQLVDPRLRAATAAPPAAAATATPAALGSGTAGTTAFQQQLAAAAGSWTPGVGTQPGVLGATAVPGGVSATGARRVQIAAAELGVTEQPPGSNDSPRIAEYRAAMRGAPGVGPWCAYFTSWVAQQAGTPLGETGQGFASVDAVYAWAQRTGRAVPNSASAPARPQPGDLIVWDEHIGLVESVAADGTVHTIEGNSSDQVIRRQHAAGSALGYVRLG
ncbi:CHAP domain-containing protein [Conexibacter sp. W3-3-2]|uniref:CHAP domain-containing protein n=1 Tax=Conexibacter sp. W3-3-2 TaxID=2675227 RepID=UPI0012B9F243|nr:CHAP domain-containing protein [Conexibacter sp. W3-3-2]MTD45440.1 CHAP domain-containing protein [Conexibacter sp. W3-3-2]